MYNILLLIQKTSYKQRKNWFDQECETEKENLKSLGKQISTTLIILNWESSYVRKIRVSKKHLNKKKMLVS